MLILETITYFIIDKLNHIFIRFSRICVSNKKSDYGRQIFEINFEYKNDDIAHDFEHSTGVESDGNKYLGVLPPMEHIK
jgi:hypothetical protein